MSKNFTEEEAELVVNSGGLVEEVYYEDRKGVSQTFYVINITEEGIQLHKEIYGTSLSKDLCGYWRMDHATDLRYTSLSWALRAEDWVRCEPVEVKTTEWRVIEELRCESEVWDDTYFDRWDSSASLKMPKSFIK